MWLVGQIDTPGFAQGVAVAGDYVYIADNESGLRVVDVSNPAAPVEVGSLPMPGYAPSGTLLWRGTMPTSWPLAGRAAGGEHIRTQNPSDGGVLLHGGELRHVAVAANSAYVANVDTGLRVVNVSNPASPFPAGFLAKVSPRAWSWWEPPPTSPANGKGCAW